MRQELTEFVLQTRGRRLYEFTAEVQSWVRASGIERGLLTLQVRHTSASLLVQENADPEVQRDMERFLDRLVPQGDPIFRHTCEGPDDMPATPPPTSHVSASMPGTIRAGPITTNTGEPLKPPVERSSAR